MFSSRLQFHDSVASIGYMADLNLYTGYTGIWSVGGGGVQFVSVDVSFFGKPFSSSCFAKLK